MIWFDIFNTRETALLIWVAVIVPFVLWSSAGRKILGGLFRMAAGATALHKFLLLAFCWVVLELGILRTAGLWSMSNLKATLLWMLVVPLVSTWRILQITKMESYFLPALRDTFALTILVEFVIDFYPLALWAELFLLPVAMIATLL